MLEIKRLYQIHVYRLEMRMNWKQKKKKTKFRSEEKNNSGKKKFKTIFYTKWNH